MVHLNNKGEIRLSEQLTNSDAYIKHYPERMNLMATEIGNELRKYGSNTVKTFCRKGEADSYETIVRRVHKRMDDPLLGPSILRKARCTLRFHMILLFYPAVSPTLLFTIAATHESDHTFSAVSTMSMIV